MHSSGWHSATSRCLANKNTAYIHDSRTITYTEERGTCKHDMEVTMELGERQSRFRLNKTKHMHGFVNAVFTHLSVWCVCVVEIVCEPLDF